MSVLTLSGWGQPADALAKALGRDDALVFDYSDYADTDAAAEALRIYHDCEHIVGWSLGAQLALHAVCEGVLKPKRITLIGAPFQFVQSNAYAHAMDRFTFDTFCENYARDPARTATRFHALIAQGDSRKRDVMAGLENHADIANAARWLPWLEMLDTQPLSQTSLAGIAPVTIIHGAADAIVHPNQAHALAEALPDATVQVWEGVAHAPQLHDPERFRGVIDHAKVAA